jgi:hypothetical protein
MVRCSECQVSRHRSVVRATLGEPKRKAATLPPRVSLLSHVPALVLALAVVADLGQFADPDLWGHIHFGQAVLGQHHFVWRDSYLIRCSANHGTITNG